LVTNGQLTSKHETKIIFDVMQMLS